MNGLLFSFDTILLLATFNGGKDAVKVEFFALETDLRVKLY